MARYLFDCRKCTNRAISEEHGEYCLPTVRDGAEPIVLHDMGKDSLDYFTCDEFTTEPRTAAIYEMVYDAERGTAACSKSTATHGIQGS